MSDESPTARSSGTLAVFEMTVAEALSKLDDLPASKVREVLKQEAVSLQAIFRFWSARPPLPEERAAAIGRLMDLHRSVEELASRRSPP